MPDDALIYYLDNEGPTISRRLSSQAGDFDVIGGQTFRLMVRAEWDSVIVLDQPMDADVDADELTYEPQIGDFPAEGIYKAWIQINVGGNLQDTDEFTIHVFTHAPGEGVRIGAVWQAARALSPVAWDALRAYRDYGDIELQRIIELAKLRVLRRAVIASQEIAEDPRVIDFIAKKLLVDNVLPAAIDYWTSIIVMQSARASSNEIKSYPDRIKAVEGQIARFEKQLADQVAEIDEIIGSSGTTPARAPVLLGGGPMITPDLDCLPIPNARRRLWDESECL